MVRTSVLSELRAGGDDRVVWPDYEGYSFHRTVPTAMAALGADVGPTLPDDALPVEESTVDRVLFLLVDGFGVDRWRAESDPLTARFDADGTVTPLTAVYPSETAAAIPSLHLAAPPAAHGSVGWDQYVERVNRVVSTLPFRCDGEDAAAHGFEPDDLFVGESVYGAAADGGVDSEFVASESLGGSPASERFDAGASRYGGYNLAAMAEHARRRLEAGPGTFTYWYMSEVDHVGHDHGIDSGQARAQRRYVAHAVGAELLDRLDASAAERTLVVLTADHGVIDTEGTVDLREVPAVWENRREVDGRPVPPVGGSRNVHLRLEDGAVPEARAAIADRAAVRAFTREEALSQGLFGPDPGERIRRRCGDLVVVPDTALVWHDPAKLEYVGMHGGLSPEEMLVPFAVGRASDLQR